MRKLMYILVSLLTTSLVSLAQNQLEKTFLSPDGQFKAKITDTNVREPKYRESLISVLDDKGNVLSSHDFTSSDGQHGAGALSCSWSPDGQYLVVHMGDTGGHQPEFDPIVIWSLRTKRLYQLTNYTASQRFLLSAPDRLTVSSWPELKPTTILLHALKNTELRQLK